MNAPRAVLALAALVAPVLGLAASAVQPDDLTTDEATYLGAATTLTSIMVRSFDDVAALTAEPRFADLDWQNDFLGETAVWQAVYAQAQELEAPDRFSDANGTALEGYALYDEAAVQTRAAIEALDPNALVSPAELIGEGAEKIQEASDRIDEINEG